MKAQTLSRQVPELQFGNALNEEQPKCIATVNCLCRALRFPNKELTRLLPLKSL